MVSHLWQTIADAFWSENINRGLPLNEEMTSHSLEYTRIQVLRQKRCLMPPGTITQPGLAASISDGSDEPQSGPAIIFWRGRRARLAKVLAHRAAIPLDLQAMVRLSLAVRNHGYRRWWTNRGNFRFSMTVCWRCSGAFPGKARMAHRRVWA